ncbi:Spore coat protein CotO [Gracilibacillus ureilyticus]|uniref:Spore coat protein CotO n=1 Tax=Gracilibacillus ureilyticus TaxID=531814 RepID=A0A1H9VX11_9BACI|nr:CotO family spore coat protein [Gracilibacillus ureilyticus]SES26061.1 Spore coat protein CotO [Gracilibacillus ureilyticus]
MSSIKRNNQSPKLYLHQPTLSEPSSKMQSVYQSNKRKRKEKPGKESKEQGREPKVENKDILGRKKFKDMTITEKVEHFAAMPMHLPRVRCEVITERKKYYGFIYHYQSGMVSIKTASKAGEVSVPIEQIQAINIAGF